MITKIIISNLSPSDLLNLNSIFENTCVKLIPNRPSDEICDLMYRKNGTAIEMTKDDYDVLRILSNESQRIISKSKRVVRK